MYIRVCVRACVREVKGYAVKMSCLLRGDTRQEDEEEELAKHRDVCGVSQSCGDPEESVARLNVRGKVECVALEFRKGDGRMLQVVEQHLDLRRTKYNGIRMCRLSFIFSLFTVQFKNSCFFFFYSLEVWSLNCFKMD